MFTTYFVLIFLIDTSNKNESFFFFLSLSDEETDSEGERSLLKVTTN